VHEFDESRERLAAVTHRDIRNFAEFSEKESSDVAGIATCERARREA